MFSCFLTLKLLEYLTVKFLEYIYYTVRVNKYPAELEYKNSTVHIFPSVPNDVKLGELLNLLFQYPLQG